MPSSRGHVRLKVHARYITFVRNFCCSCSLWGIFGWVVLVRLAIWPIFRIPGAVYEMRLSTKVLWFSFILVYVLGWRPSSRIFVQMNFEKTRNENWWIAVTLSLRRSGTRPVRMSAKRLESGLDPYLRKGMEALARYLSYTAQLVSSDIRYPCRIWFCIYCEQCASYAALGINPANAATHSYQVRKSSILKPSPAHYRASRKAVLTHFWC